MCFCNLYSFTNTLEDDVEIYSLKHSREKLLSFSTLLQLLFSKMGAGEIQAEELLVKSS